MRNNSVIYALMSLNSDSRLKESINLGCQPGYSTRRDKGSIICVILLS